jgi:hypothetical protein
MAEGGYASIRPLAQAIGEHRSHSAGLPEILGPPADALAALREHSVHVHVRGHFTGRRLRQVADKGRCEADGSPLGILMRKRKGPKFREINFGYASDAELLLEPSLESIGRSA